MALYRELAPVPEVKRVVQALRAAGHVTGILSNGSPQMLDAAVTGAGLSGLFDAVMSVDAVQAFKTHPSVYRYAADRLGMAAGKIAFVSSNGWDAYAASDFGMQVVWCNRYGQPRERLPGQPDAEIATLAELPALLGG
jgi:2-haloacid dehalogenase